MRTLTTSLIVVRSLCTSLKSRGGPTMSLFDFDANFLHRDLRDDFDHHFSMAQANGVDRCIVPGSTLVDSAECLALSRAHHGKIFATCGIHPYRAQEIEMNDVNTMELSRLVSDEVCLAVGETGLDYSEGFPSRDFQVPWFKFHVHLSEKHGLPLFLHIRDAHDDFLAIMDEFTSLPNICVHCFTGSDEELREYCRRGFYISISGHVIRKQINLKEWLAIIPPDRLLIETDAPYMGWKGCRSTEEKKKTQNYPNVPAALSQLAKYISKEGDLPLATLAERTTENAMRFICR